MSKSTVRIQGAGITSIGAVRAVGHQLHSRGLPDHPMRILGSYAVVYVLAGNGRFADAHGFTADITAGDLIIAFPDVPHTYGPPAGSTWGEVFILFNGPVFDLWRDGDLLDPSRPVRHLEPVDHWARAFDGVLRAHRQPDPAAALIDVCRLQAVLANALAARAQHIGSEDQHWLARAQALLDGDTRRDVPLEDIADQLAISYDGFRKRFRRLAGISPARYRSQRSIDHACELLAEGKLTNRQIAAALGFSDEFHFSHRFRQVTGQTPRQFRGALPRPDMQPAS